MRHRYFPYLLYRGAAFAAFEGFARPRPHAVSPHERLRFHYQLAQNLADFHCRGRTPAKFPVASQRKSPNLGQYDAAI